MKIGIIGSSGFIGKSLKLYFEKEKKYKVIKFVSFKKTKKNWTNKVCSQIKKIQPEIIINCSADQDLNDNYKSINNLIKSNILATSLFLNQFSKNNPSKLYISFGTKYEFDKNKKFNPLNFYATTKHASDLFLKYYSIKKGITTISLKIFDTYGQNDKRKKILNLLKKAYKNRKALNITDGNQYLDFVHIDDLCNLIKIICDDVINKKIKGFNTYTVSSLKPTKLKSLINILNKNLKFKLKVNYGKIKYKNNQLFEPQIKYKNYPGWQIKKNFLEEINKIF